MQAAQRLGRSLNWIEGDNIIRHPCGDCKKRDRKCIFALLGITQASAEQLF